MTRVETLEVIEEGISLLVQATANFREAAALLSEVVGPQRGNRTPQPTD
jgi:hypothetical protein